jgi:hypothetical protein
MSGTVWLLLGCLAVGWWVAYGRSGKSAATSGRMVSIHGHGSDRPTIAVHEAGHVAGAIGVGGRVRSARMNDNSGLVQATVPDAKAAITFLAAGAAAAGTKCGADHDEALIRKTLKEYPRAERAGVEREARADAARIVRSRSAQIRRNAARLNERGRL